MAETIINSVVHNKLNKTDEQIVDFKMNSNSIVENLLIPSKCIINIGYTLANLKTPIQPQTSHFKCRFDPRDPKCQIQLFTRTTNVEVWIL